MISKIIKKIEERMELAQNRNFETIYLTLKPDEMSELLLALKQKPINITELTENLIQEYLANKELDTKVKGQIINELKNIKHEVENNA
ncbi:MAG: hypothetical protein II453_05380 [Alphaproteobacteria bacterium]|nr:hypothetical protein [Alphaproteobacteria bacterium]